MICHIAWRILIVTPYFWPSVGGVEKVAESLAVGLQSRGHAVKVATYTLSERKTNSHRGISINDLTFPSDFETASPYSMLEVKRLLESGQYDACILLGAPLHLMFYGPLAIPKDCPTRFILQPTINKEIDEALQGSEQGRTMLSQLGQRVNAVVTFGGNEYDERFFQERRIPPCVIPNGTAALAPKDEFRQRYGVARDTFLVIHLANLYTVKNHPGLLDALDHLPEGVQLVLIGNDTHETEYVEDVKARLAARPDVRLLAGLDAADVASALSAADLVVLASHAELRLLDIGGACTLLSRELGRFGAITMVEHDAEMARFAAETLGLEVKQGSLPDGLPADLGGPFDVITLIDVLEHIDDDVAAARAVRGLLRPGGVLIVSVPAVPRCCGVSTTYRCITNGATWRGRCGRCWRRRGWRSSG